MTPIPGYEGKYSIDEEGKIFSHISGYFLAPTKLPTGYCYVSLVKTPKVYAREYVHRLMAKTFLSSLPIMDVDHKDGCRSNNVLENLRLCSRSQNLGNRKNGKNNSSGFKGVSITSKGTMWRARIMLHGKEISLGRFAEAKNAAKAYDEAAVKHFGEFARLNNAHVQEPS